MMKRPKAKKKGTSHSKVSSKAIIKNSTKKQNKNQQVDWKIWVILGLVVFLILAVLLNVLINVNGNVVTGFSSKSRNDGDTSTGAGATAANILAGKPSGEGWTKFLAFFNSGAEASLQLDGTWQSIIMLIVVLAILLAGFYDMLALISIFDNDWVKWVIAIGMAVIASITGLVRGIAVRLIQFAATFGAIGLFLEVIIVVVVWVGLSMGSTKIAKFAMKRKMLKEKIKAIKA